MPLIPDFSDSDLDIIRDHVGARFQDQAELHLADAELRLDKNSDQLTECPTVYWQARDCSFVVFRTGLNEFRCQFFYDPSNQFATGHEQYDDLSTCVSALLQVQSDHERERQGVTSGVTGKEL